MIRKCTDEDISDEELEKVIVADKIPAENPPREACKLYPWFQTSLPPRLLKYDSYYFGLKVDDTSMEPKVSTDDYVICQQGNFVDRDDLCVARKKNEDAIVRYIMVLNYGFTVMTLNTLNGIITETYKYEDIDKKIEILGRCVSHSSHVL